ncbi:MAG: phosphodiester glycosidase family protein [Sporichthyaceae bacterium]
MLTVSTVVRRRARRLALAAFGASVLAGSATLVVPNAKAGAPVPAPVPAAAAAIAPPAAFAPPVPVPVPVPVPTRADVAEYLLAELLRPDLAQTTWLAPGVMYATTHVSHADRTVVVRAVTINPSVADGSLVVANRPGRRTRTSTLTRSVDGLVGINGSFFHGSGHASGLTVRNGRVVSRPTGYAAETTLVVDSRNNTLQIARVGPAVRTGLTIPAGCKPLSRLGSLPFASGPGCHGETKVLRERNGGAVRLTKAISAITGRFRLVESGKVVVPDRNRRLFRKHERSIAGTTRDGRIVLATINGGVSLKDAARIAQGLGMSEAVNLDGGGSTSMAIRGRSVNRAVGERAVSDALVWRTRR